jgi:hypothetical protein
MNYTMTHESTNIMFWAIASAQCRYFSSINRSEDVIKEGFTINDFVYLGQNANRPVTFTLQTLHIGSQVVFIL